MDPMVQVQLYIELLNHYIYFLEKKNDQITVPMLNQIIQKIYGELPNLELNDESEQINKHLLNTIEHIRFKSEGSGSPSHIYHGISLEKSP